MTVQRYTAPNHPRWYPRTPSTPMNDTVTRRRYGRSYHHRDEVHPDGRPPHHEEGQPDGRPLHREEGQPEGRPRSGPPLLQSRDATGDDTKIELRNASDRVWITTELPDRLIDDVHVSVSGASIRIRAEPSDAQPRDDGVDRTITLAETVDTAGVVVAYDEPVLTVIAPIGNR